MQWLFTLYFILFCFYSDFWMAVSNGKSRWHSGGKTGVYLCFSCAKSKESPPQPLQGGAGEGSLFYS